jgi:hypothetical protein
MHERIRRKVAAKARMVAVERLWNEGVKRQEIARRIGASMPLVDCDLKSLRALGRIQPRNVIREPRKSGERSTRADDEKLLTMLRLREEGMNARELGERFGMPAEYARASMNRTRRDYEMSETKWWTGREWVDAA